MDPDKLKEIIRRYENVTFTVNRRINAMFKERLADDLTVDQYATIRYIWAKGRCTSSELADVFCVGKSSITAIITRLTDKRFIRRVPDDKDRRVIYLELTEEGEKMAESMQGVIQDLLSGHLNRFTEAEAEAFLGTFEKLARVMASGDEGEKPV
jgi:DNA-binding MarR family transcriptional regulator